MGNIGPTPTGNIFLDTIDRTVDPTLPSPTSQIFGSSSGVADADGVPNPGVPTNEERADALFPFFNGVNQNGVDGRLLANPTSLDGVTEYLFPGDTPTLSPDVDANGNPLTPQNVFPNSVAIPGPGAIPVEDFFSFHSAHQLQYVDQFGTDIPSTPELPVAGGKSLAFIRGDTRFDIVTSPDGRRVFILQQLTKADVAILSREDQDALAGALGQLDADVRAQLENVIGAQSGGTAREVLEAALDLARDEINGSPLDANGDPGPFPGLFGLRSFGDNPFNQANVDDARKVFLDQLENLEKRANESAFINQAEINTRIDDLMRRARRADAFFAGTQRPATDSPTLGFGPIQSLDREGSRFPGLENAFKAFIAQETRIRDLDNQRLQLAQTGFLNGGRALDGPNLIAIFQLNYNLVREAEVNAETEELTQQNALLRDYAAIQQLVNDALAEFDGDGSGDRNILGFDGRQNFLGRPEDVRDKIRFISSGARHPIEELRGIQRPDFDLLERRGDGSGFFDLKEFSQNQLNIFASQLADTVTQINQESQILTNEISNLNRERNRHFDLANNALRRLNDSLQTIARI